VYLFDLDHVRSRPVVVRFVSAPRVRGLSYEEFQAHWRGEHGAVAGQIPGITSYVQNHAVLADGLPLLPYVGFDALSEISFDSIRAMDEGYASEHFRGAVTADEQVLVDKTHLYLLLAERRVLDDRQAPNDAVKLITCLPLEAGASMTDLDEALAGPYRAALSGAPVRRHEQLLEIAGAHEGRVPTFCAAADLLWFDDADAALAFLRSERADRARRELTGLAFGAERIIARPVTIV
jgi:uncharacterized protein (TIGR02118 family)